MNTDDYQKDVAPGYIGISLGQTSKDNQAIIWGGGEDFYFFPVTTEEAGDLEYIYACGMTLANLYDILPDAPEEQIFMFMYGHTDFLGEDISRHS